MTAELPAPECELGYTEHQIAQIMGPSLDRFNKWMSGQTMSICDGRRYNHKLGQYEATGCGPHGTITYSHDVRRFLSGGQPLD